MKVPLAGGTPSEVSSFCPRAGLIDFTVYGSDIYASWWVILAGNLSSGMWKYVEP